MFGAIMAPMGAPPKVTIEGSKMIVERSKETKCPMVFVSEATGLPLKQVCSLLAKPMAMGVFKTVNPSIQHAYHEVHGDYCKEVYEIQ
jgi:hypothetical protein